MKQKEFIRYSLFFLVFILATACTEKKEVVSHKTPEKLPMKSFSLKDMNSFSDPVNGWELVKNVFPNSLATEEGDPGNLTIVPGEGVLLKTNGESKSPIISTGFEHEDLEVELEFFLPKGATVHMLFQEKYVLELSDTWQHDEQGVNYCGTIVNGDSNVIPSVNACKAPGLWQKLKVFFRCPRFDEQGNKVEDAQFESVYLNDFLIHRKVNLSGVSDLAISADEKKAGSLSFKTENAHFAVKNFRYQAYTLAALRLENITYSVFDSLFETFPDFTKLHPVDSGVATPKEIPELNLPFKHYGLLFKGNLDVPVSDTYLFQVDFQGGGELLIDGKPIKRYVLNSKEHNSKFALVEIKEGLYPFELRLIKNNWRKRVNIFYESSVISKKDLFQGTPLKIGDAPSTKIGVEALEQLEMIRSFVRHLGEAKTHVISVGNPQNIHYTYNLKKGSLIKLWRGSFADATAMWESRGQSQLLHAGNSTLDIRDDITVTKLASADDPWPDSLLHPIDFKGYHIDSHQRPVYTYSIDNVNWEDQIEPSADGLGVTRSIHFSGGDAPANLWCELARGNKITQLNDLLYLVDGNYFLRIESGNQVAPVLRNETELLVSIPTKSETTIQYSLIW